MTFLYVSFEVPVCSACADLLIEKLLRLSDEKAIEHTDNCYHYIQTPFESELEQGNLQSSLHML